MSDTSQILAISDLTSDASAQYISMPDEATVNLVADLYERARVCGQPFKIEQLDRYRHPRGLCVGISTGENAIAIFYASELGQYAWEYISRIHVAQPANAKLWVALPLELGMLYWFRASNASPNALRAEAVGTVGPLKERYLALHRPLPKKPSKKSTADDDSGDLLPTLRPHLDESEFQALKSLEDLGL